MPGNNIVQESDGSLSIQVRVIGGSGTTGTNVQGAAATGATATGNPIRTGGVAESTTPTAVSDGQAVDLWLDTFGRLQVGGATSLITVTPVLSVAGAYVTGDYIGTTTTPQSFAGVVRTTGGKAIIQSLTVIDKVTTAAVALELWLLSATFTAPTDNAAWAITDAEALTVQGVIPITTDKWYASSNNKVYTDSNIGLIVTCAATSLFMALVARGSTPTWASGDLQVTIGVIPD